MTDSGDKIIVEMQNREHPHFVDRTLYYASEAIARQGEKGVRWHYDVKAVYLIAFVNFSMGELPQRFRTDAGLTDLLSGKLISEKLRLVYLQLPFFVKEAEECNTDFERWIFVLKNMETLNRLPWAAQNKVFERLSEIAEVSALTKEEREQYDGALRKYRDTMNVMMGAEQKGRAEGRAEERLANARSLLAHGVSKDLIVASLGLTEEELSQL